MCHRFSLPLQCKLFFLIASDLITSVQVARRMSLVYFCWKLKDARKKSKRPAINREESLCSLYSLESESSSFTAPPGLLIPLLLCVHCSNIWLMDLVSGWYRPSSPRQILILQILHRLAYRYSNTLVLDL